MNHLELKSSTIPQVMTICVSPGGIPKRPMASVYISRRGLDGDGHNHEKHNRSTQAVSLMDWEHLAGLGLEGFPLQPGSIGENLTLKGLFVQQLPVGTILEFSGGVVLELTKVRQPCYVLDQIDIRLKEAILGRCGYYAQVLKEGFLEEGASVRIHKKILDKSSVSLYTFFSFTGQ